MVKPTFFHAGFPKTGTTWLHACLKEHPEVFVSPKDAIHYLTIHFNKGEDWYMGFFRDYDGEKEIGDTTPSYVCYEAARTRMKELNPDAKILLTLRNPIDRAFSHYWHLKRKGDINLSFGDVLGNRVEVFDAWIGFGFYYEHIRHLQKYFPKPNIKVLFYEQLLRDPRQFYRCVLEFLEVNAEFTPRMIDSSLNTAKNPMKSRPKSFYRWFRFGSRTIDCLRGTRVPENEYEAGIPPRLREELASIYRPHNQKLEDHLGVDLAHWR